MPYKIVDAIDEDGTVAASYPIIINNLNAAVAHEDFIQQAMEDHKEDGLDPDLVTEWRVREPTENDPL